MLTELASMGVNGHVFFPKSLPCQSVTSNQPVQGDMLDFKCNIAWKIRFGMPEYLIFTKCWMSDMMMSVMSKLAYPSIKIWTPEYQN